MKSLKKNLLSKKVKFYIQYNYAFIANSLKI